MTCAKLVVPAKVIMMARPIATFNDTTIRSRPAPKSPSAWVMMRSLLILQSFGSRNQPERSSALILPELHDCLPARYRRSPVAPYPQPAQREPADSKPSLLAQPASCPVQPP